MVLVLVLASARPPLLPSTCVNPKPHIPHFYTPKTSISTASMLTISISQVSDFPPLFPGLDVTVTYLRT